MHPPLNKEQAADRRVHECERRACRCRSEAYLLSHCCNGVVTKVREKYDGCKGHQDIYSDLASKESW